MTAEHNHPPRCCCIPGSKATAVSDSADPCPLCVEHGELAQLGKECPSCHTTAGHPHTDYCQTTDPAQVRIDDLASEGWTRLHPDAPGQWLHYEGDPSRTDHRAAGGTWHPVTTCTRVYCGATPEDGEWPKP